MHHPRSTLHHFLHSHLTFELEKEKSSSIHGYFSQVKTPPHPTQIILNICTFTLSNLGMFGVDRCDAILPPGTGAIMVVGASEPTVVVTKDGRIDMKSQMQMDEEMKMVVNNNNCVILQVNVTADHRVIYGADLAQFLQTLAKIIEDPKDLTF
ncbi:hypothetical protein L6452_06650 [Arctium lappa]|uniref:Uncharacterized protein n=1 Tax=Arctium lappa TaxID=4217 RepID=A0ACB9EJS4_ARCLA|nr:hypothetical protein L6452_06650 [Arctium lappa]